MTGSSATTVSAQLRTLSSVIAEEGIDRIDLLKINVEKSELDVLLGLEPRVIGPGSASSSSRWISSRTWRPLRRCWNGRASRFSSSRTRC